MKGRSTSGTTGLGTVEVSGRRRVPCPPTRITAWMRSPPPDALVHEPRGAHGAGVERVATVDHEVPAHARGDLAPVELEQLAPLGHEHGRVGALERGQRRVGEVDAGDEPARLLL